MSEPHLNLSAQSGQVLETAQLTYIGGTRRIPRARFVIVQAKPFAIDKNRQRYSSIIIPCEVHGRQAEGFVRTVGKNSWIRVQGWWRSYDMNNSYPQMRLVVTEWNVLDRIMPTRGHGRRRKRPDIPNVPGTPNNGEHL